MTSKLSHIDQDGNAQMVDVSGKQVTTREAIAQALVTMSANTFDMVLQGDHKKGDVLAVARIAGIQAAKRCSDLIPLCHPLALSSVKIDFEMLSDVHQIRVLCRCKIDAKTGVEMEALTGANIAALTIYDMCKAVEKGITISDVKLLEKTGGKSGDWHCG